MKPAFSKRFRRALLIGGTVASLVTIASAAETDQPSAAPADTKPYQVPVAPGDYRVVELTLAKGVPVSADKTTILQPNQTVRLAFRGQNLVNWWFLPTGATSVREIASSVVCDAKGLRGELQFRRYVVSNPAGDISVAFDLKREGEQFSGTCRINTKTPVKDATFPVESSVSGRLASDVVVLTAGADWPAMGGPTRTMSVSDGPVLVDDLALARPLWRSEVNTPVSYGNTPDGRYCGNARLTGTGGGSSSPVVANGVVYQGFYRPSPATLPGAVPGHIVEKQWGGKDLPAYTENWLASERRDLEDFFRPAADDHLVAIDAATGKTLWRTVWPQRSFNYQTHKHRGLFGVPLVAAGKVFYPNLHGHLMVMDARTGAPLWEYPEFKKAPKPNPSGGYGPATLNQSPFLVGDTLIWHGPDARVVGLSVADGSVRWTDQLKEHRYPRIVGVMQLGGKPHILTATGWLGGEAALLDAADGREVWRQGAGFGNCFGGRTGPNINEAYLVGDQLVGLQPVKDSKPPAVKPRSWRVSLKGIDLLWEGEPIPVDEGPAMAVTGKALYLVGANQVRVLDLKSGQPTGTFEKAKAGSNPYVMIAGSKAILSPEGQHGGQHFMLYALQDGGGKPLGAEWTPPHPSTTAYNSQPLVYPLVDGRLFIRAGNGIYCYDLRATAK